MPLPDHVVKQNAQKLIDAIGSFKKTTGIPNHPKKSDTWDRMDLRIYAKTEDDAEIIAGMVHNFYWGDHGPRYYDDKRGHAKDFVDVRKIDDGCYEAYASVGERNLLALRNFFDKTIERRIRPDTPSGRSR